MNGPVLVTGATGFAGGYLVQHLSRAVDVVGWGRRAPAADVAALARWQRIDVLDRDGMIAAMRELRPSMVFHCAGLPQVADAWTNTAPPLEVNVLGTHRLLEALRLNRIACRVLVTGSAHVYAPATAPLAETAPLAATSPYGLSKLAQEQLALRAAAEDGIEIVVARSFNHTGPRQSSSFAAPGFARQVAAIERGEQEPVVRVGNLDAVRDVADVRDTVRAYEALMKPTVAPGIYNVASGIGCPMRDILGALLARARVPIRVEQDPGRMRPSDIPVLVGDPTRVREATGWEPAISFDQMLDDLLDYWRGGPRLSEA